MHTCINILRLYSDASKYSVAYPINGAYFSNVSRGLWLAVQVVSVNQQYPVVSSTGHKKMSLILGLTSSFQERKNEKVQGQV